MNSIRRSFSSLGLGALLLASTCNARDVVIHAGTLRNPLANVAEYSHVRFVTKGGIVYRRDGAPTAAAAE